MVDWRCDAFVAVVDRRNKNLKATSFDGSFGPPYLLRKPHGLQGRNKHTTTFFTSKVRQSILFEKGAKICESFTRKPRRNELFLYFRERHGKTRDGLLSSARLHRSGRPPHRGWCGTMVRACSKTRQPARRPNLRCALLRPVSQSGVVEPRGDRPTHHLTPLRSLPHLPILRSTMLVSSVNSSPS